MAFCAQCGFEAQGNFCEKCGAKLNYSQTSAQPAIARPLDENIACAACYLLWAITGILFLVLEPYNRSRLVKFHAYQSIIVGIALFCGFAALRVLPFLPFVGWMFTLVTLGYPLFGFVLWIVLMYKAFRKESWELPIVGQLARSMAEK
jgi:uncharacterized membrane protein